MFGENKFDIPVLHARGVEGGFPDCDYNEGTFYVPDHLAGDDGASLVFFYAGQDFQNAVLKNQYDRLTALFGEDTPELYVYTSDTVQLPGMRVKFVTQEKRKQIMHCGFVTDKPNQYIFVDEERRIRGYYGTDLDEVDRLIVEIKILLQNGTGD